MTPLRRFRVAGRSGIGQTEERVLAKPPFFAGVPPLVLKDLQPRNATCPTGEVRARLEIAELFPCCDARLLVEILGVVQVSHRGEYVADNLPLMEGQHFVEFVAQVVRGHFPHPERKSTQ